MSFPKNPIEGQIYTNNSGVTYVYNSRESLWDYSNPEELATLEAIEENSVKLETPTDYLIFSYTFNDLSGSIVKDSSGDNHGTQYNCISTPGVVGNGFSFDGSSSYINTNLTNKRTTLSFSVWIRHEELNQAIFGDIDSQGSLSSSHISFSICEGFYNLTLGNDESYHIALSDIPDLTNNKEWHHIILSIDIDKIYLYIDNQIVSEEVSPIPLSIAQKNQNLYIGKLGGYNKYFKGEMDQFKLYSRILTGEERSALYSERSGSGCPGKLLVEYLFEEISGSTILDTSGYNHHGEIIGDFSINSCSIGNFITFDPELRNYLDCGIPLNNLESVSISFWLRTDDIQDQTIFFSDQILSLPTACHFSFGYNPDTEKYQLSTSDDFQWVTHETTYSQTEFDNRWHHFLVIRTRSKFHFYIDGVFIETINIGFSIGVVSEGILMVSKYGTHPSLYQTINGSITKFRIYKEELGLTEARWLASEIHSPDHLTHQYLALDLTSDLALDSSTLDNSAYSHLVNSDTDSQGTYFKFNGDSYLEPSNLTFNLSGSSQFSLSAWLSTETSLNEAPMFIAKLIENQEFYISFGCDGVFTRLPDGEGYLYNETFYGWTHLVVILDSSESLLKIYINSKLVSSESYQKVDFNFNPKIGENFLGSMDKLRFFRDALLPAEVTKLYNNGVRI